MGETQYFIDYKVNELKNKLGFDGACDLICSASKEQLDKILALTKDDLKPGMVVLRRNRSFAMVMFLSDKACICTDSGCYTYLSDMTDDLKASWGSEFDIVKVYGYADDPDYIMNISDNRRKLLWERKEPKKMTVDDMKKELEEKYGEEIEVIKNDD